MVVGKQQRILGNKNSNFFIYLCKIYNFTKNSVTSGENNYKTFLFRWSIIKSEMNAKVEGIAGWLEWALKEGVDV